jgi:hypothetical protein
MLKYFIIIVLIVSEINSLSSSITDFCFSIDTECKGDYSINGVYKTKCQKECKGKYEHKCSYDICGLNNKSCDSYNKNSRLLGLMHLSLQSKIKTCPLTTYKITKNDFCINDLNCFEFRYSLTKMGFNRIKKPVECKCKGINSYKCSKDLCSINDKACILFNKMQSNDKKTVKRTDITKCGNNKKQIFSSKF